jgi:hypothetical protein
MRLLSGENNEFSTVNCLYGWNAAQITIAKQESKEAGSAAIILGGAPKQRLSK